MLDKKNTNEIGFEERERKTPFLGYVLLVAMVIVVFLLGSSALDDLKNIPKKPETLSFCSSKYIEYGWEYSFRDAYLNRDYYKTYFPQQSSKECNFSEIEKKYGIDKIFSETKSDRKEITEIKNSIYQKELELQKLKQNYELGLLEDIADAPKVFKDKNISENIQNLESEIALLKASLSQLESNLEPSEKLLKEKYALLQKEYKKSWKLYEFYVFLLQALFVFPLFFALLKFYFRLSAKNSPYLIIFTFLLIPASIFVVQIVFVYFWSLFLGSLLETLWSFIKDFQILKSLLSYLGMILSALIFGGAVYLLQKRIFDPKRLAKRRLRDKKCPNCSFSLDLSSKFCSFCGQKIMKECLSCKKNRYIDLDFCGYCGKKD